MNFPRHPHKLQATSADTWSRWLDFWFRLDLRSLGLFRILLSVVLLWQLLERWPWSDALYTSQGLLPASELMRGGDWLAQCFDLFTLTLNPLTWLDAWPWAVKAYLVVTAGCYLLLMFGYRTRLATLLSLLLFAWLSHRNRHVMIGADYVMAAMLVWSLLLPLGARFSLDGLRQRMRQGVPLPSAASDDRGQPHLAAPSQTPRTIAAFGIVLQIGLVYFCTAYLKQGPTWWRDGTAVYYTLYLEQSIYAPAEWVRNWPLPVLQWLTWGTLAVEFAALPMLLIPFWQPLLRRLCIIALIGLHLGIAVLLDAGLFSYTMIATFALLLCDGDWEWLRRVLAPLSRPATVYYDDSCGVCHRSCQLLAIADRFGKLSFIGSSDRANYRHAIPEGLTEKTVVVFDDRTGRQYTKAQAAAAVFRALPLPFRLWCWIGWPGFRVIGNAAYDTFARNRHLVSQWLGLTACGIPQPSAAETPTTRHQGGEVAGSQAQADLSELRQPGYVHRAIAVLLLVGMLTDCVYFTVFVESTPSLTDPRKESEWVRLVAAPFRLSGCLQRWNMFSPDASANDLWWVLEVETADGRRLNAFNPRQKSAFEQPLRTQRMFNSVMGEYFKHGMFVEADPASAESQMVARTLLEYFARQLQTKWEQLQPAKVRVYRMLKQAPNPLRPDAHRMKLIHKVGEHDIATGQFEPADKFAYGILYRSDGTRYREGSVEWKTMLEQGRWLTYRPDGKTLWSVVTVRDGIVDGPATAWDDDNLRMVGYMRDDKHDGYWRIYHPDGWKFSAGRFRDGKRVGVWEKYYPGGGRQQQVTFVDGVENGPAMSWYDNGQPWRRGEYRNGKQHGTWTTWHPDGTLASRGDYVNGSPHGSWTIWTSADPGARSIPFQVYYEHGKQVAAPPGFRETAPSDRPNEPTRERTGDLPD